MILIQSVFHSISHWLRERSSTVLRLTAVRAPLRLTISRLRSENKSPFRSGYISILVKNLSTFFRTTQITFHLSITEALAQVITFSLITHHFSLFIFHLSITKGFALVILIPPWLS
jgi:hypothetical protein